LQGGDETGREERKKGLGEKGEGEEKKSGCSPQKQPRKKMDAKTIDDKCGGRGGTLKGETKWCTFLTEKTQGVQHMQQKKSSKKKKEKRQEGCGVSVTSNPKGETGGVGKNKSTERRMGRGYAGGFRLPG